MSDASNAADDVPSFGALLAPLLGRVSDADRPRFLALLERSAAERYRTWAELWPEHETTLSACAGAEDEIAERIEAAFACTPDAMEHLESLLPEARAIYYGALDGLPVPEQLRIQAAAELQGAAAWRNIAARLPDDEHRERLTEVLAGCSALEEASSARVAGILAGPVSIGAG